MTLLSSLSLVFRAMNIGNSFTRKQFTYLPNYVMCNLISMGGRFISKSILGLQLQLKVFSILFHVIFFISYACTVWWLCKKFPKMCGSSLWNRKNNNKYRFNFEDYFLSWMPISAISLSGTVTATKVISWSRLTVSIYCFRHKIMWHLGMMW